MEIMKIASLALVGAFVAMLLKQTKGEYSLLIGLLIALFISGYVISNLLEVVSTIETVWNKVAGNTYFLQVLLRMIGITYISDLTGSICKESGYLVLSNQVLLAGKLGVLLTGFPILLELLEFIIKL